MPELKLPTAPAVAAVTQPPNYLIAGPPEHSVHAYLLGLLLDERDPRKEQSEADAADADETTRGRHARLWGRDLIREPIIAIEFAGPKFAVEAARRWLRAGKWISAVAEGKRLDRLLRLDHGSTRYAALTSALPSGWVHALMLHPHATLPGIAGGGDFYLVEPARDPRYDPDARRLAHFAAALDAALPFPVLPTWDGWLWERGSFEGLITPLPVAVRLRGYRIAGTVDRWRDIIISGVRSGALRAEQPASEEGAHGTADHAG